MDQSVVIAVKSSIDITHQQDESQTNDAGSAISSSRLDSGRREGRSDSYRWGQSLPSMTENDPDWDGWKESEALRQEEESHYAELAERYERERMEQAKHHMTIAEIRSHDAQEPQVELMRQTSEIIASIRGLIDELPRSILTDSITVKLRAGLMETDEYFEATTVLMEERLDSMTIAELQELP